MWLQQHNRIDTCSKSNYNSPDAFGQHGGCSHRVHGVSLTHRPPEHVWTFAAGLVETFQPTLPTESCPCVIGAAAPTFVGNT